MLEKNYQDALLVHIEVRYRKCGAKAAKARGSEHRRQKQRDATTNLLSIVPISNYSVLNLKYKWIIMKGRSLNVKSSIVRGILEWECHALKRLRLLQSFYLFVRRTGGEKCVAQRLFFVIFAFGFLHWIFVNFLAHDCELTDASIVLLFVCINLHLWSSCVADLATVC